MSTPLVYREGIHHCNMYWDKGVAISIEKVKYKDYGQYNINGIIGVLSKNIRKNFKKS